MPEIGQISTSGVAKVGPRQDGGPLGAQLLGRWLGAPIGAQRVPGGDGEAALRARAQEKWAGPEARGWLGLVSAARRGSLRRCRAESGRVASRCTSLGSFPWSHSLACDPAEAWRESPGFPAWHRI